MANSWSTKRIDEIAQVVDSRHKTPQYSDDGYPMVRVVDVKGGVLQLKDTKRVNEEVYADFSKGRDPEIGDLIISRVGSYGNVAYVNSCEKFCLGQNTALIIPEDKSRYLYYALTSPQIKAQIDEMVVGAVQKTISLKTIKSLQIPEPPSEVKTKISKVLSTIDDKIELNRKTNQTLEQMAQALFKSWFVDFDPVFDNALASGMSVNDFPEALQKKALSRQLVQQQIANGELEAKALPEYISQLFPSEFEQSDEPSIGINGWIPKGWNVCSMNQHAIIQMGQSPKGDTYNDDGVGTPLVNGPVEFDSYFTKESKWTTSPTKLSKQSDLIVCVRGSTTGRFVKSDGVYCLGRGVCSVRGVRSQVFTDQIFKNSIKTLLGLATGSTFPNWSRQILNEFNVIQPQNSVIDLFDRLITSKVQKVELNVNESESLAKLRDTILPKLISGEISINSIQ